jgi:DNA-binding NarL/FixJ family response regulator
MKHTIVIVDDHLLIAKALGELIGKLDKYEVLYEVENGKALQDKLQQTNILPDIILMDVSMPIMNGFEATTWLKENHPNIIVVALSMQDDEQSLVKMIQCGASGYLLKNIKIQELDNALQIIIHKGFYYPDWATSKLLQNIANEPKKTNTYIQFSERELEFFKFVCTEKSYKEIAEEMFCSPRTVEGYRDALFEKLDLKSRVGLAVYAMKNGLT